MLFDKINLKKISIFIVLTFAVSGAMIYAFQKLGGKWNTPQGTVFGAFYMFVPMIITVAVQKGIFRQTIREPLAVSFRWNRWFFIAWFAPMIFAFATLGMGLLLPGIEFSPSMEGIYQRFEATLPQAQIENLRSQAQRMPFHPFWISFLQAIIAGISINAVAGFGEELGWRGLLLKELQPLGFWRSSLLTGFIWGVWHAPLILLGHNYPFHPRLGVLLMILWCMLLSPLFSHVTLRARSVIAASILHGSLNANAGLPIMVIKGGSDLVAGVTGLAGFLVLGAANIALWQYRRKYPMIEE